MALVKRRISAVQAREITVLRSQCGLEVRGIVNCMRPGVRGKKFILAAEALAQICAEAVIDGTAVRKVRVHVAEGNAASVIRDWRDRVAVCVEAGKCSEECHRLGDAGTVASQVLGYCNRWIQPRGTEEIGECRADPRTKRSRSAGS